MTIVVPLPRRYNLGNALSVVGTLALLAERLDGVYYYPDFERYDELFEGRPSRHEALGDAEAALVTDRLETMRMETREVKQELPRLPATYTDAWFDYLELAPDTLAVRNRGKYFSPLEAIDEQLLGRYRLVCLFRPYHLSYQVSRPVDALRDRLRMSSSYVAAAHAGNAEARGLRRGVAGVHLRLGDYRRWRGGRYAFELSEVMKLLKSIEARDPGEYAFRIFSNELDPAEVSESVRATPHLRCSFEPGDAFSDFCALAHADVVFGPPSSFGHWAAFLGGRPRVVLNEISLQRHVVGARYLDALRPVTWPFSAGLENDFWIV